MDHKYVLFRDPSGRPVAVPDACPHRGAPLSKGRVNARGELTCPYHGWRINERGEATSPSVPKKRCTLAQLKTWERYGYIWVAAPDVPDSALPDFLEPGYDLVSSLAPTFDAPFRVAVDNFSEIEHAFRVHRFIGPSEDLLDTLEYQVEIEDDRTRAWSSVRYRSLPLGMSRIFGIRPGDRYHNDWTFSFRPACGTYHNYWTDPEDNTRRPVSFLITTFFVPTENGKAQLVGFLQLRIDSPTLRLLRPIITLAASAIFQFEIWMDARVARFAPDTDADGQGWQLTGLDRQIPANRRLLDRLYFDFEDIPEQPALLEVKGA